MMTVETNRYHMQQKPANPSKHNSEWSPVDVEEMKAFTGITVYMGIVKLPWLRMYWSTDVLIQQQAVSSIMVSHTLHANMEIFSPCG